MSLPQKLSDDATDSDVNHLDLDAILSIGENCVTDDGSVYVDKYILAYAEVLKLLNLLGTIFGWATIIINDHIKTIQGLQKSENSTHFITVQSMLAWELQSNMIKQKSKNSATGTWNLLFLNHGLEVMIEILEGIPDLKDNEYCCKMAQQAYKNTLMKVHPWIIQKIVLASMNLLPTRAVIVKKLFGSNKDEYNKALEKLPDALKALKRVYITTHELFKKHDLHELPAT